MLIAEHSLVFKEPSCQFGGGCLNSCSPWAKLQFWAFLQAPNLNLLQIRVLKRMWLWIITLKWLFWESLGLLKECGSKCWLFIDVANCGGDMEYRLERQKILMKLGESLSVYGLRNFRTKSMSCVKFQIVTCNVWIFIKVWFLSSGVECWLKRDKNI